MVLASNEYETRQAPPHGHVINHQDRDQSADNTLLAVTTPTGKARKLFGVTVRYSATPTHTGITVELDSGHGTAWDCTLNTSAANALNYAYLIGGAIEIGPSDAIRVTAPAGGVGITSAIQIHTKEL